MHEECRGYFEKISEFLDDELEDDICEKIKKHLHDCPECQNCFGSLKKTVALFHDYPREEVPEEVRKRLRNKLGDCLE